MLFTVKVCSFRNCLAWSTLRHVSHLGSCVACPVRSCANLSSIVMSPVVLSLLFSCCPVLRFRNSGLTFSNSPRTWRASSGATSSTHRPVGVAAGGVVYAARVQQRPTGCLIAGVRRRSNALRCADPTGANEWPLKALKSPLAADSTPRTTTAD